MVAVALEDPFKTHGRPGNTLVVAGPVIMGEGFQFFDILLFAMVAAFLVLRLRSVLGRRTGNERPPQDRLRDRNAAESTPGNVVTLPERGNPSADEGTTADSPVAAGLTQVKVADPEFDTTAFLSGVRAAFEMIVTSFASGDTDTLKPLTSGDVFADLRSAIEAREKAKQVFDSTLVGIRSADIIEAQMDGRVANLTVKIVSEQINVTRDEDGEIVEGSPSTVAEVTDIWTFARDTRSRNPNWTLIATRSSN